ncbi:MAG: lysylphosphatidylglycerol synthase transmembrane domain-containing protein [Pirellulaceae bacterium]
MRSKTLKKHVITFAKLAVPAFIILWLLMAIDRDQLGQLVERPKDGLRLGIAFALVFFAVGVTFVRWHLLVRALDLTFRLRDAFRLGFLGFLLNFVSVGAVGGDLFKAFFIAREQPGRRTEAVATVVVDRIIGLFGLLLATSVAILLSDLSASPTIVRTICRMTFIATGMGFVGMLAMLWPGFTQGRFAEFLAGIPRVGKVLERIFSAIGMYRGRPLVMVTVFAMSMAVHGLLAVAVFLIATALFERTPTLAEHFLVVPLSNVAGALPFTPAGLGSFEFAMDQLYQHVPRNGPQDVVGILVALVYRLFTIAITAVGVVYYWACRREIRQVMDEAERAQHDEEREPDGAATYAAAVD